LSAPPFIYAVGDIGPDREAADDCFALVREAFSQAQFVFGQLETSLSTLGTRLPQARHTIPGRPAVAPALRRANLGVISCAGNHCLDWGNEALLDTIANLERNEIQVVGAGANIAAARRPIIRDVHGIRVAFLAYCSILPQGYWAEERRPGCAPMRAWTHYEQVEHDQPGTPARINTFAHREDLAALKGDIGAARALADCVVVSIHWGIHFIPAVIADYQREVGHAAIDAGADVVLGHHAHILKGAELYRDRPIFYSIGNFAIDLRMDKAHAESKSFREIQKLNPAWIPDFDSLYNFPEDSRKTLVIKITPGAGSAGLVRALPAFINREAQPQILTSTDPRFAQVRTYLNEVGATAGLNGRFVAAGEALELRVASEA
jgi:poly-gamma-glutamate capsule biosynthesis protein CapA/YwtB (metallophosphatase superfamily)